MYQYQPKHKAGKHYYKASIALQTTEPFSLCAIEKDTVLAVSTINKVELNRLEALGYTHEDNTFYCDYDYWLEAKHRNYRLKDEYIAKHKLEIE